jgi:hypothetical protein
MVNCTHSWAFERHQHIHVMRCMKYKIKFCDWKVQCDRWHVPCPYSPVGLLRSSIALDLMHSIVGQSLENTSTLVLLLTWCRVLGIWMAHSSVAVNSPCCHCS